MAGSQEATGSADTPLAETRAESRPEVASRSTGCLELVHPGGIVVRVGTGCDAASLRTVLDVLDERQEGRPC
jgi:hypothetical protein